MSASTASKTPAQLAELADALRGAAGLPAVLVTWSDSLGEGQAVDASPCVPVPIVELGAGLLQLTSAELIGALAHEVAHHASGWSRGYAVLFGVACQVSTAAMGAVALALALGVQMWIPACLVVLAAGSQLLTAHVLRRLEYEADALAVQLLDRIGMPGRDVVQAMLWRITHRETRWDRLPRWDRLLWFTAPHPPAAARLRAIGRG
ncbi:M48 family metalloprotease [Sphaerisporangium sp. TRM90804]|uniref:M48 family metalloprotease n=1 Tax=Sphaerisporangium sp. TRM90804 TaxID=3031113 RepID=UPI00244AAD59|nr:M48 family metalloprotease [Sphaerisporangium sp. TRM90804]MDH2425806.1 M48 family metalloprotease [Sphaerisporangium sp. TRM90804]